MNFFIRLAYDIRFFSNFAKENMYHPYASVMDEEV